MFYYIYILTNKNRTTLYVGITNNIARRLLEHREAKNKSFSKLYNCHYLVYFERYYNVLEAINREKEIKKWRREKKNALIEQSNPHWRFLNPF